MAIDKTNAITPPSLLLNFHNLKNNLYFKISPKKYYFILLNKKFRSYKT
jgi:hypothetical protein